MLDKKYESLKLDGVLILPPEVIKEMADYDIVMITAAEINPMLSMRRNLLEFGVPDYKIKSWLEYRSYKMLERFSSWGFGEIGSRVDMRLIRLEILQYYGSEENYKSLTEEQRAALRQVQNWNNRGTRKFPEDPQYETRAYITPPHMPDAPPPPASGIQIGSDDGCFYWLVDRYKIYVSNDKKQAQNAAISNWYNLEYEGSPHQYLRPETDGIDVPGGSTLLDVGAAEGYLGIKYIDRCKKVYFFECEPGWIKYLKKSVAPYQDKIEIIQREVGDREGFLNLDEYFGDKEKPNFVKIDVEGAEGAVLRSMRRMIESDDPLTLLICTYHRQEDWDRYEKILNPDPERPRFDIFPSAGYYWHMPDAAPPYFRRGVMRARKRTSKSNP